METIQPGKYVELGYDLYEVTPDGDKLVHQTSADDPEKIVFGVTPGVIVPLERAIDGLKPGDTFDVKVSADEAFGPHDTEQVATLPRDIFEVEGKFDTEVIKKGAVLPMMTQDGFRINGVVVDVTDSDVVMDFNHPLAGKDVRFKGKITVVRDATPDELKPQTGCGCGEGCGCGDSCDCSGESKCSDGCGCN